ncbi:MAG: hypothetical protein ABFD89_16890 [Bryobacteraceae bacterium]
MRFFQKMGRIGGLKGGAEGGKIAAQHMTDEERRERAKKAAAASAKVRSRKARERRKAEKARKAN